MISFKTKNVTKYNIKHLDNNFTIISNQLIQDAYKMGPDAYLIMSDLLRFSNSQDHYISVVTISKRVNMGKGRVQKAINKLIEFGYIKRTQLKNGNLNNGYLYEINNVSSVSISKVESEDTEGECALKEPTKKEKEVVVVDEQTNSNDSKKSTSESSTIKLFKTFNIEKRVLPQTISLIKEYENHFDIEVFREVFENAVSEHIKNKFKYIKKVLTTLYNKGIRTFEDYKKDYNEHIEKKYPSNIQKNANNGHSKMNYSKSNVNHQADAIKPVHTRYHNIEQRHSQYGKKELEQMLRANQRNKFGNEITENINPYTLDDSNLRSYAIRFWDKLTIELKERVIAFSKEQELMIFNHMTI